MHKVKWATIIVLFILSVATYLSWYWVWGLLFLYWALNGIKSGEAFLIEPINRSQNRVLFWMINLMWTASGVWTVVSALIR